MILNPALRYIMIFFSLLTVSIILFFMLESKHRDHISAISLKGSKAWYQNYDDMFNRQMQDRDILYHNIGHAIDEARKADIIILGHSMVLFGMQNELIESFSKKHHIRIYNLATAGDGSGEFIRRVIKKWKLHPKLWIINADDHAAPFFSISLDDFGNFGKSSAANVVSYTRMRAYLNVIGRNITWQLEEKLTNKKYELLPNNFSKSRSRVWRNIYNGNWYLEKVPAFVNNGTPIKIIRDQNCHASLDELKNAPLYIRDLKANILLILMPHSEYCPQRLNELAEKLKVESIIFKVKKDYTTIDQTHLNKTGAYAFTKDFLMALENSDIFKKIFAQ